MDDLHNSQLPQLFPDTRPGAPAGSVDKQAIINDLMQLTADSSPAAPVGAQKPALRMSQSSEYALLPALLENSPLIPIRSRLNLPQFSYLEVFCDKTAPSTVLVCQCSEDSGPAEIPLPTAIGRKIEARHGTACMPVIPGMVLHACQ